MQASPVRLGLYVVIALIFQLHGGIVPGTGSRIVAGLISALRETDWSHSLRGTCTASGHPSAAELGSYSSPRTDVKLSITLKTECHGLLADWLRLELVRAHLAYSLPYREEGPPFSRAMPALEGL